MRIKHRILFPIVVFLLLISSIVFGWSGKVVGVSDGDTISVMHEGKPERIRLYGIDCPERGQPFGTKARKLTSRMVFGKIVEIKPVDKDRYGRTVAWVFVQGKILNVELVKAGLAWHYKQYSRDKDLALFEEEARGKRIGLWSDPNRIPPWKWRRMRRLRR